MHSSKAPIRVLIVEDQELVRVGLKTVLAKTEGLEVAGTASDGRDAVEQARSIVPDVIVMDIGLPFLNGIEASKQIKEARPETKIVMLTSHDDEEHVFAALGAGVEGYCLKESSGGLLTSAILSVSEGAAWLDPGIARMVLESTREGRQKVNSELAGLLTKRELEVLKQVVDGRTNQEIADGLFISIETVKTHMRHIMEKLRVTDRTQAAVKAMKEGLI
ncbi:MAG: response regulator transcription factor [Candidatus Obscuribacterales bacterium]|nr:response regulator transcription factor [Cyanobacteria bacterium HKST-UBA01]MCB9468089.1 response regulator transcription factor [Candidatus Obscuribacterales bacterium]